MGNYAAYPSYKDSGVKWLGEIPEHWEAKRFKFLLSESFKYGANEAAEIDDPDLPRYIRITDVKDDGTLRDDTFRSLPEEIAKDYLLEEGDILLARSGATVGKTFIYRKSWGKSAYAGYLIRARTSKVNNSDFIYHFLQSSAYWDWVKSIFIQATIQNVSAEKYANFLLAIPSLDEQKAIAAFLDYKTQQIDQLIAKKESLLEKLDEKRTALISNAVTKGLDPTVPMKDSGVEWLGEIPEYWEAKRFKFLLSESFKYGANEAAEIDDPDLPRYIRITDVKDDGTLRDDTFRSLPEEIAQNYLLEEGDILLARSGATVGKTFIYRKSWGKSAYAGYLIRARISQLNNSNFIYHFLQSSAYWDWVKSIFIQATIQNVSAEKYANFVLSIPPLDEQYKIVQYLDQKTAEIDQQKAKILQAIDLLKEYRTALITNAVTGKIDVRSVPIPTP